MRLLLRAILVILTLLITTTVLVIAPYFMQHGYSEGIPFIRSAKIGDGTSWFAGYIFPRLSILVHRAGLMTQYRDMVNSLRDFSTSPSPNDDIKLLPTRHLLVRSPKKHRSEAMSHDVPVAIYEPKRDAPTTNKLLPVMVFLHGGGFMFGDIKSYDKQCRQIAARLKIVVMSIDYRKAPTWKHPHGFNDTIAAIEWMFANGIDEFGGDQKRVIVTGESAGALLAFGAAYHFNVVDSLEGRRFSQMMLIYPPAKYGIGDLLESQKTYAKKGLFLTAEMREIFARYFLGPFENKDPTEQELAAILTDWSISPLTALKLHDFKQLPPTLITTAEHDLLRDEGRVLAETLTQAGVSTRYVMFEQRTHGHFADVNGNVDEELLEEMKTALADQLGTR